MPEHLNFAPSQYMREMPFPSHGSWLSSCSPADYVIFFSDDEQTNTGAFAQRTGSGTRKNMFPLRVRCLAN
jgi:hypothetical protein